MNKLKLFKLVSVLGLKAKNSEVSIFTKIKTFLQMLFDAFTRKYKPKKRNILLGTAVLIYVVSPIDLIPLFFLDDVAIVMFALKYFEKEINNYLLWKDLQTPTQIIDVELVHGK